jgi:KDO2-lipid IV(A) lauroyltransferase
MVQRPFRFAGRKQARAQAGRTLAGAALSGLLRAGRLLPRRPIDACLGMLMRTVGPWLRQHDVGRRNLAAAFPEKSREDIEDILAGVWTNLGRVAAEFVRLEAWAGISPINSPIVTYDEATANRFLELRDDHVGALLFSAHIGNWELPAIVARAAGLQTMVLYRPPSVRSVAYAVHNVRTRSMGEMMPAGLHATFALARALQDGKHVGMLADQHDGRGVAVNFFGRPCRANPLIAMLAREYDVPIHGVYAKRLAAGRFKIELTPRVMPVKNASGQVDIPATMQRITDQIEAWVRDAPEQWLWVHRRWRDDHHKDPLPGRTRSAS